MTLWRGVPIRRLPGPRNTPPSFCAPPQPPGYRRPGRSTPATKRRRMTHKGWHHATQANTYPAGNGSNRASRHTMYYATRLLSLLRHV